jgi:hypothetical protein
MTRETEAQQYLCQFGDPLGLAEGLFQFEADAKQAEVIAADPHRLLLCCSRQWGKSTTAAVLVALRVLREAGSLVVIVSPTLRQTAELVLKVRGFLERVVKLKGRGRLLLELPNGSRVLGLPGNECHVRGFSAPSLVVIDEAARVGDLLYKSLRPMLAHGGDLALLSTPFGERGFFWKEWAQGGEGWTRVTVKATECARIPAAFLEEERRVQGEDWFRQEYLCEFVGMDNQVFRQEWFERAVAGGLDVGALDVPLDGEVW